MQLEQILGDYTQKSSRDNPQQTSYSSRDLEGLSATEFYWGSEPIRFGLPSGPIRSNIPSGPGISYKMPTISRLPSTDLGLPKRKYDLPDVKFPDIGTNYLNNSICKKPSSPQNQDFLSDFFKMTERQNQKPAWGGLFSNNSKPLEEDKLTVYDFPNSGFQMHIHEQEGGTAHLKTYMDQHPTFKLSSYDAAIAALNLDKFPQYKYVPWKKDEE